LFFGGNTMSIEEAIKRLLGRSWSSYAELRGAVRKVGGVDGFFDCFEEWQPGVVIIRKNPIGKEAAGFTFQVSLKKAALAA
jgi:hypothetical protein